MVIHRFNGIMMRITHNGQSLYIERSSKGYRVTHCTKIPDGILDTSIYPGNLDEPGNLERFLRFMSEKLKLTEDEQ